MKPSRSIDINYIVTLLFLLLSSNANFLSANTYIYLAVIALMFALAVSRKELGVKELRVFLGFSAIYVVYVSLRFVAINDMDTEFLVSDYFFLCKYIFLAFIFCALLKKEAIANVVRVVTHLTILSFFFYAFQLLAGDTLHRLFSLLSLPNGNSLPGYSNFILFTYTQGFHEHRNSGFVWEPGSFGCFLMISLLFNAFLNRFRFDATAIILIVANITTFSTTNYISLLLFFFLAYRYRVARINFWLIGIISVAVILIITIPFLGNKIVETYEEDMRDLRHLKVLEKYYRHNKMQIPLNRFSSMVYIWENFREKLIMGVSNKYNEYLNEEYTVNISNGLFDFLAKFGLIGLIYLFYRFARFCYAYLRRSEIVVYCILLLITLSFGEPVLVLPFFLMFLFLDREQVQLAGKTGPAGRQIPNL